MRPSRERSRAASEESDIATLTDTIDGGSGFTNNVHVVVRIRPLIATELAKGATAKAWTQDGVQVVEQDLDLSTSTSMEQMESGIYRGGKYAFRQVYGPSAGQESLYATLGRPVVQRCCSGYNGTLFAYGQTASGKHYEQH